MSQILAASVAALRSKNWLQLAEAGVTPRQAMALKSCTLETATRRLASAKELLRAGSARRLRWHLRRTAADEVGMEWAHVADASRSRFSQAVTDGLMSVPQETADNLPTWGYYTDPRAVSREASPATRAVIEEARALAGRAVFQAAL